MFRTEFIDGFVFDSIVFPFYQKDAIHVEGHLRSLEDYQKYINEHGLQQAKIVMPDLKILQLCPSLKYLDIYPSYDSPDHFDFSPLYDLPEVRSLQCQNCYGNPQKRLAEIDFSRIRGLVSLSVEANKKAFHYNKVETLKSLSIGGFRGKDRDLTDLFCSRELDTLQMVQCGMLSLNGIETSQKMQCLYLYYNRSLCDISALGKIKHTLKALRIENCPKIQDFSVLGELENLELLELSGRNVLPDLRFLKTMKNLKLLILNMNVLDGNLSPCLDISCVHSCQNRKHYNLKDSDLPKGPFTMGNEDIELWRHLE